MRQNALFCWSYSLARSLLLVENRRVSGMHVVLVESCELNPMTKQRRRCRRHLWVIINLIIFMHHKTNERNFTFWLLMRTLTCRKAWWTVTSGVCDRMDTSYTCPKRNDTNAAIYQRWTLAGHFSSVPIMNFVINLRLNDARDLLVFWGWFSVFWSQYDNFLLLGDTP